MSLPLALDDASTATRSNGKPTIAPKAVVSEL